MNISPVKASSLIAGQDQQLSYEAPAQLLKEIFQAARETAVTYTMSSSDLTHNMYNLFRGCGAKAKRGTGNFQFMCEKLDRQPSLARSRYGNWPGVLCYDGATPLHLAAKEGNCDAIRELLDRKEVSSWVRDMQGRTPLHLATREESKNEAACLLLKEYMIAETGVDPTGVNAPRDLLGLTPIAHAQYGIERIGRGKLQSPEVQKTIFKSGDPCVSPLAISLSTNRGSLAMDCGCSIARGWCGYQEDRIVMDTPLTLRTKVGSHACHLFAVLDGHGGDFAAEFVSNRLATFVTAKIDELESCKQSLTAEDLTTVLLRAAAESEAALKVQQTTSESGCTLVAALITQEYIAVANIGDSRCLLGSVSDSDDRVSVVSLTEDHKATILKERERIIAAGFYIRGFIRREEEDTGEWVHFDESSESNSVVRKWYVCENKDGEPSKGLEMSRSIGDFYLKTNTDLPADRQAIIAVPDIRIIERNSKSIFLVLSSDGVFESMNNEEVVSYFSQRLDIADTLASSVVPGSGGQSRIGSGRISEQCAALLQEALDRGT